MSSLNITNFYHFFLHAYIHSEIIEEFWTRVIPKIPNNICKASYKSTSSSATTTSTSSSGTTSTSSSTYSKTTTTTTNSNANSDAEYVSTISSDTNYPTYQSTPAPNNLDLYK